MSGVIKPMADIFLSYAKEDRDVARQIATLLGNAGWVVWWDRRIPAGRTWRSVLEDALQDMRCMVVLWSAHSIESDWVRDEADEARVRKKLVPVLIEAVNPPVGFRNIQAADLSEWDGSSNAPGVQQLLSDLESLIGKPAPKKGSEPIRETRGKNENIAEGEAGSNGAAWIKSVLQLGAKFKTGWKTLAAGGLGILMLAGVALLWPNQEQTTSQNVETGKANPTPQLVSLALNADRKEIKTNETLSLTLRGEYSDGTQKEIKDGAEWVSSDSRVAIVDAQGQVKALEAGTAKIVARYGGVVTPEWTLAISAPKTTIVAAPVKLVALMITGTRKELMAKEKISLQAKGSYSDGREKTLSSGLVWESSSPAIAAVSFKGEIEGLRPGQADVVVRSGGLTSSPMRLVVKPAPRRVPLEAPPQKGAEASPVTLTPATDQLKLKTAPYITRARDYRVQGNYAAALADLEKARRIDPSSAEIAGEIDQTKRACNAERKLGRKDLDC
jgi:hypothetical protein